MTREEKLSIATRKANEWLKSVEGDMVDTLRKILLDESELLEAFFNDLEFGTGGLRGVMGVGTARINTYTIGMATQGLANYLVQQFHGEEIRVAIAYDSRNHSPLFASAAAAVLSAAGIRVYLFAEMRPTPLLSFAVRDLKCHAGIVVTASHNPPEYNGYKVYWQDGGQITPPHDKGIIDEVRKISSPAEVNFTGNISLIHEPPKEVESNYIHRVLQTVHLSKEIIAASPLKIVYTSLHGAGITMVPEVLSQMGFQHVTVVPEQAVGDGNFPTVKSPNPEEKEALTLALGWAEQLGADMVIGTDPDTDRVGMAVRDEAGKMVLVNGNQAGALIAWYELSNWKKLKKDMSNTFIARTIVTSDLIDAIGAHYGVQVYKTLTGFKYIAGLIAEKEGKEKFICGGEESYGYLVDDFVRDKDGVISSAVLCELAASAMHEGKSVWQVLMEIYRTFGVYYDEMVSITIPGLEGVERIASMMNDLRNSPPAELGGSPVIQLIDYKENRATDMRTGRTETTGLPISNVMQFHCQDGSRITARPSGTEPKIKFYFSLRDALDSTLGYDGQIERMKNRVIGIRKRLIE